jgi:hypothetical protein
MTGKIPAWWENLAEGMGKLPEKFPVRISLTSSGAFSIAASVNGKLPFHCFCGFEEFSILKWNLYLYFV